MARIHRCYQGNETKLTPLIPTFLSLRLFRCKFVAPTCSHFGKKALSRMVTMGARGMMSFHAITHRQGSETRHTHIYKKGHQHHRSEFNNTHTHQYGHPLLWVWNKTHTSATTAMGLKQDTHTRNGHPQNHLPPQVWKWDTGSFIKVVFYQRFDYTVTSVRFRLNRTHTHTKETRRNVM